MSAVNELSKSIIKCVDAINFKAKYFFKKFCEGKNTNFIILLLNSQVSWQRRKNYFWHKGRQCTASAFIVNGLSLKVDKSSLYGLYLPICCAKTLNY